MNFTVLTIFPELMDAFFDCGIVRRAVESRTISCRATDIRDFAEGRHRQVDDRPYGGGNGMVMKPESLAAAIDHAKAEQPMARTVLLSPQGRVFTQQEAERMAAAGGELILICGRYEGVDERICETRIDDEISIGDYVLTGGEVAAMIVIEATTRLIPGALGGEDSAQRDTFQDGLVEHAHYTRPPVFEEKAVPDVLLSGNHAAIDKWRLENALMRTLLKRPDLLENRLLKGEEQTILREWCRRIEAIIGGESDLISE
ncbi:MAG: tRNA (guanosine(37)-N1)-methyltransferase TrmD [Thermodesulfobacteriota bacterium]|nr:tRNA (guanosine(37)-N1)-methyltransferase TrmD [Thermodesulfobacteriota bacterium]